MKRSNRNKIVHHALAQDDHDDVEYNFDDDDIPPEHAPSSSSPSRRSTNSDLVADNEDKFEFDPRMYAMNDDEVEHLASNPDRFSNHSYHSNGAYFNHNHNHYSNNNNSSNSSNFEHGYYKETKKNKKLTRKEFLKQLQEKEESKPSFILPTWAWVLIGFGLFAAVTLYMQFGLHSLPQFHGFTADDDMDDDVDDDDNDYTTLPNLNKTTPSIPTTVPYEHDPTSKGDKGATTKCAPEVVRDQLVGIKYDPDAGRNQHDPFHVQDPSWYGGIFQNPPHPSLPTNLLNEWDGNGDDYDNDSSFTTMDLNVGYMQYPDIFDDTIVFCSEGDIYLTSLSDVEHDFDISTTSMGGGGNGNGKKEGNSSQSSPKKDATILPAMRLTSTVGNVNTPKINPKYPYLVAFTATYTGRREAYLMDLRANHRSNPSMRLTYMDSKYGVMSISGWEDDGTTLVVSSYNMEVAMEDVRLYKIGILVGKQQDSQHATRKLHYNQKRFASANNSNKHLVTVSSVTPVPLSQAIDSVIDGNTGCRFFTRYKQSSNTIRYVGGTAENLWAYCPDETLAVPLTGDYNGTSKAPQIYTGADGKEYLLFLSDRVDVGKNDWRPSTMNLWYVSLPGKNRLYGKKTNTPLKPKMMTSLSCQTGMHVKEYSVDHKSGNIILRIGADLHMLTAADIQQNLSSADSKASVKARHVPIAVYSDFNNLHERMIPLSNPEDVTTIDAFGTNYGTISSLMTARGQVFVNPVVADKSLASKYGGGAMNLPPRRYRVAPGSSTGGMIRVLGSWHIPSDDNANPKALLLATDPASSMAEMAFYVIDISPSSSIDFADVNDLPMPLVGGHLNGGSVKDGGLGSIVVDSVALSPCGRRFAWTDTDGRIVVMSLPKSSSNAEDFTVLPQVNDNGEPMTGIEAGLTFSPGGRYLAIEHAAKNQFRIITIGDLGDPSLDSVAPGRFAQATPDRFNSMNPLWGRSPVDFKINSLEEATNEKSTSFATTLFFLTDRDVILTETTSPWGSRAPQPFFGKRKLVYALPLISKDDEMVKYPLEELYGGSFVGGGAAELMPGHIDAWDGNVDEESKDENQTEDSQSTEQDVEISFGVKGDMEFARRAYVISEIPGADYIFLHQVKDDPSLILVQNDSVGNSNVVMFAYAEFPKNSMEKTILSVEGKSLQSVGLSSDRNYIYLTYSGETKIFANKATDFVTLFVSDSTTYSKNIVDTDDWVISVWPQLEYQQMYSDAWRMLRDYYYDPNMGNVDWNTVHEKYLPLVSRCGRREELDDVLKQMSAELSALHVFVYGGEYNDPSFGNALLSKANEVASLGAVLERSIEWGGYLIKDIPHADPDFNPLDGEMIYSPLSDRSLKMSGQKGLLPGDVIVGVNGESVLTVPDIHMLLRGMAGRSIRLDVLRIASKSSSARVAVSGSYLPEPIVTVPLTPSSAANLRYASWEWKTRQEAKRLAEEKGFTIGYTHLRSMSGATGEDSFVRGFYPDFDKQGLIIDVRHNVGGNIDSWLLTALQRKAWMYWQGRATNITTGGLGWDEQFAFRGHIIILIDEKTSSDGEGFSRGISELGLGQLVGTRTWGGGIWLASDNKLVDGGIASAPEFGTYNNKFGWGLGIEQMGVEPDVFVDNNPRQSFEGKDQQLERAIELLHKTIQNNPIKEPNSPGPHKNMALQKEVEGCSV